MAYKPRFSAANDNDILNDQRAIDRGIPNHQIEHCRDIRRGASARTVIVKELAMKDLDRLSRNRVESFALGFFGLLCAMAVGFVSELKPPASNSVDHGYDERLGAQTLSPSGENLASNCSDNGAAVVGGVGHGQSG